MITAYFKKRTIIAEVKKELNEWELSYKEHWGDPKRIADLVRDEVHRTFTESIRRYIDLNFDQEMVDRLTKEMFDNFDYKSVVDEAMKSKLKSWIASRQDKL